MISIIGVALAILSFIGLKFFNFNVHLCLVTSGLGGILVVLSLIIPRKPKFKSRELVCEHELLPISENIYAIKTADDVVICKYINEHNATKIKNVVSYWTEINELETGGKACIRWYERKTKFTFTSIPFIGNREEVDINIPKGTIIY